MTKIIECPRDAWQAIHNYIPVEKKALYINKLLEIGFDTIDFGSFVSPKIMPQMKDTAELISYLDLTHTSTRLLSIVANEKGAEIACSFPEIQDIGYPFSLSDTFQIRNTHKTMEESVGVISSIQNMAVKSDKKAVLYLSMGFGNPYGDYWHPDLLTNWVTKLSAEGITTFSLSDTIGLAIPKDITYLFQTLQATFPELEFGAHFHSTPNGWFEKIDAAYQAGCRRFDSSISGFGGCPMAQDELVGNIPTEKLLGYLNENQDSFTFDQSRLKEAISLFSQTINNND